MAEDAGLGKTATSRSRCAADRDGDAELLERLATAKRLLQRVVTESDVEPGIAAATCAELAGEYAAMFAAEQGLPPGPVLDEVARLTRRRGAAVHHALAPGAPIGSRHELPRDGEARGVVGNGQSLAPPSRRTKQ